MKQSSHYSQGSRPKVIVAIPAFNEEKYIGTIVLESRQHADEVIVVDDGSTDQTANVARLAGATVLQHTKNKGKGAAIQRIFAEAKRRAPDVLVLLDADSQHNPNEISYLIKPILEGFDLVIGSRKAQANNAPPYRRIGQKILLHSAHILSRTKVSDSECGFRALSRKAISEIRLSENGFAVETEMIARIADKGFKITEVPVSSIYTRDGSTLNPVRHGLGVLFRILALISERRPLFFFGLGGGILVILGLITGGRVLQILSVVGKIPVGTTLLSGFLVIIGTLIILTGVILHVLTKRRD